MREGASFIRSSRLIRGLIIGMVGAFAAGGAVIGAGKTFVTSLGGGNAAYGVLFGAVFVGLGSGMAFGPRIARELSRRRLFGLSIVFAGVCLLLTALMPQVALAMIFVVGVGFGAGVAYLAGMTLMGTDVDDEMRGRVFALLQSLVRVVLILALAAVPFIVGAGRPHDDRRSGVDFTVDGTRIVLIAGGAARAGRRHAGLPQDGRPRPASADLDRRHDGAARRRRPRGGGCAAAGCSSRSRAARARASRPRSRLLADALRGAGATVTVTHEPGATEARRRGSASCVLHDRAPLIAAGRGAAVRRRPGRTTSTR